MCTEYTLKQLSVLARFPERIILTKEAALSRSAQASIGCLPYSTSTRTSRPARSLQPASVPLAQTEERAQIGVIPGTTPRASSTLSHTLSDWTISSGRLSPPPATRGLCFACVSPRRSPASSSPERKASPRWWRCGVPSGSSPRHRRCIPPSPSSRPPSTSDSSISGVGEHDDLWERQAGGPRLNPMTRPTARQTVSNGTRSAATDPRRPSALPLRTSLGSSGRRSLLDAALDKDEAKDDVER